MVFLFPFFLFFLLFSPLSRKLFLALRHPKYILHRLLKSHGSNLNSNGKGFNFSYLWFSRTHLQLHNSLVAACLLHRHQEYVSDNVRYCDYILQYLLFYFWF